MGGVKGLRGLTDSCSPRCCADVMWMRTHAIMQEVNAPPAAIWELRRQDVFVPENSVNYTAVCVCVCVRVCVRADSCVVVSDGKKNLLLITIVFFFFLFARSLSALTFFFVAVFWALFKATKNISDNSDASGKIKRLLYYPSPLLFTN